MNATMQLIDAPDGAKGFDCNATVTPQVAVRFKNAGYTYAMRYVRRGPYHATDITADEADGILDAGLGLMLVQHVAPDNWHPDADRGTAYGTTAGEEAAKIGYPEGGLVWCDLEMVAPHTTPSLILGYCNAWYQAVNSAGYVPALYVGYGCGLSAQELYHGLLFRHYASGFNLSADQIPAGRGVQVKQRPYPGPHAIPGVPFEYDVQVCMADALGSRAIMVVRA